MFNPCRGHQIQLNHNTAHIHAAYQTNILRFTSYYRLFLIEGWFAEKVETRGKDKYFIPSGGTQDTATVKVKEKREDPGQIKKFEMGFDPHYKQFENH